MVCVFEGNLTIVFSAPTRFFLFLFIRGHPFLRRLRQNDFFLNVQLFFRIQGGGGGTNLPHMLMSVQCIPTPFIITQRLTRLKAREEDCRVLAAIVSAVAPVSRIAGEDGSAAACTEDLLSLLEWMLQHTQHSRARLRAPGVKQALTEWKGQRNDSPNSLLLFPLSFLRLTWEHTDRDTRSTSLNMHPHQRRLSRLHSATSNVCWRELFWRNVIDIPQAMTQSCNAGSTNSSRNWRWLIRMQHQCSF